MTTDKTDLEGVSEARVIRQDLLELDLPGPYMSTPGRVIKRQSEVERRRTTPSNSLSRTRPRRVTPNNLLTRPLSTHQRKKTQTLLGLGTGTVPTGSRNLLIDLASILASS